jgi:hypothetical protein
LHYVAQENEDFKWEIRTEFDALWQSVQQEDFSPKSSSNQASMQAQIISSVSPRSTPPVNKITMMSNTCMTLDFKLRYLEGGLLITTIDDSI